jgi:hypothetical protein
MSSCFTELVLAALGLGCDLVEEAIIVGLSLDEAFVTLYVAGQDCPTPGH